MRRLAAALSLVVAVPVLAQGTGRPAAQAARPGTPQLRIDYVEDSLPNGLKILYHVDRSAPVAAVNLWYNVGSKNEPAGRTGFAHLFEHVMFEGSKNVEDGQHFALLEKAGARGGADINGTTNNDRTNYFEQVPSNQLELALWLEADRMGTLLEVLTVEKLDIQRQVVKNERRQSLDNQPYGTWWERLPAMVFPKGHPYHHSVIGSMEDLSAATLDDVKMFFRTYYSPSNAVLVVAGDIDVPATRQLVRKHFGWIPRGPAKPPVANAPLPPVLGSAQRQVVPDQQAPAPAVYVAYRVPPARSAQSPVVSLLGSVIADGRSGRLYEKLVREQQVATNVFGGNFGLVEGADMLFFAAVGKPGANADSLERALLAELDRAAKGEFTQAELDRVRAGARFGFVNGLQTMGGFGGRADRLAEGWTHYRDPNYVNTWLGKLDRVTVAQLGALAKERMGENNRATLVFVPSKQPTTTAEVKP